MDFNAILLIVIGCTTVSALPMSQHDHEQHQPGHHVTKFIIGGQPARKGQFPYQMSIQKSSYGTWTHSCGGSLISHNTVLTTTYCATKYPTYSTRIVAGEHDLTKFDGTEQTRSIDRVISHPEYNNGMGVDIAICRLTAPFEFNRYVKAIKIAYLNYSPTGMATVSGWGITSRTNKSISEKNSDVLLTQRLPLLNYTQCQSALKKIDYRMMPENNLCVGPLETEKGPCYGDMGGPLVQNGVLVGISSYVIDDCGLGNPSAFTPVSAYTDWILQEDKNIRRKVWPPPATTTPY